MNSAITVSIDRAVSREVVGLVLLIVGGVSLLIGLALRLSGHESPASRY